MNEQIHYQSVMPDRDMAYTLLGELKRVSREYTTAATEAVCPDVRRLFTDLMNSTLAMQGQLYDVMRQQQMAHQPTTAPQDTIASKLQSCMEKQRETAGFLEQLHNMHGQQMRQHGHGQGLGHGQQHAMHQQAQQQQSQGQYQDMSYGLQRAQQEQQSMGYGQQNHTQYANRGGSWYDQSHAQPVYRPMNPEV